MSRLPPNPLSEAALKRYQTRAQQQVRPGLGGSHLTRRQGQSLDFREFSPYVPGDDIRHVDWRASARYGGPQDLLVRKYMAEEQYSLVISLDTRPTMLLPDALPKLLIASWLAEALAWVALRSGDRVVLHQLFSPVAQEPLALRGASRTGQIRNAVERCLPPTAGEPSPASEVLNLDVLQPYLPPTALWLLVTDLYFTPEQAEKLAQRIVQAQNGFRQVLLVELDSWPYEQAWVGIGARWIEGPGLLAERPQYEITQETLDEVETTIHAQKTHFLNLLHRTQFDTSWAWPQQSSLDSANFFQMQFAKDKAIQNLFVRKTL